MTDVAHLEKTSDPGEIAARLQGYFADRYPGTQVTDIEFLVSGVESDIYTFNHQSPDAASRPLILRVYSGDHITTKLLREVNGLQQLHQANFPVASIFYYETDPSFLGKPFTIMEKLEGKAPWPLLNQVTPSQADHLLDQFGGLLAHLHRLDWRPFTGQPDRYKTNPAYLLDELLASYRELYEKFGVHGFTTVVNWLISHKSEINVWPSVVHLDFHANNVFLCDDYLAVIDWTQITVSDYRADLSWTLMIMGDYGQPHWGERILKAYQLEANHPVEDLDFFNLITYMKLLASTVISLRAGPAALGLRPETAEPAEQQVLMIRRLSRRIFDINGITIPEVEAALSSF